MVHFESSWAYTIAVAILDGTLANTDSSAAT